MIYLKNKFQSKKVSDFFIILALDCTTQSTSGSDSDSDFFKFQFQGKE